ncbi:reverse transcriptase domain-containing protein [Tanacetum coccineum]
MMNQATRDSIEGLGNPKILPKSGTPYAVSIIQTASHLSPDALGNIQTVSPEPGLESSSIFTPVSYLAPTDGVGDAIVVPLVLASQFELKIRLLNLVTAISFYGFTNDDPHSHIRRLNQSEQDSLNSAVGAGPSVPSPPPCSSKEVERDPETITDQVLTESTTRVPPLVVQPSSASRPSELPAAPSSSSSVIPERNPHQPPVPYPSRLNKKKLQDKSDIQIHSFLQMFKRLHFNISLAEALAHMPKYAKMVKDLLTSKEKLLELVNTPLYENCSAILLKKLPEKLRDTGRFLIPCEFQELESCMALADLGASINLMPLSIWKKLILSELTSTRMTLELATRTVAYPAGIAEDVFVKVGKFTFPADFVVVDYDFDPRVPLILGRPLLRTARALVDVHGEELTLRVGDEKLVFNVESTLKYPRKLGDESIFKIDILDIACEDHFHEEIDTFLASDDLISPDIDDRIFDLEGDIRLIKELLNNEILNDLPPPLPVFKINETEKIKTSIEDPPDLELKDLPPHLKYAFLEGTSKLPVIIAKDLREEEKEQLLKILMEDDFKPVVQHQRRVNPKIHEVIKAEVIKILDDGLKYPISDSPWVSSIHVVPKKGDVKAFSRKRILLFPIWFSRYFQIPIDPQDQEKTTFTCPYGTFAYRRMPFGLCNAPGTFQRSMVAIFHDMIEKTMKVFMDDFSVFGDSFYSCLSHLDMILKSKTLSDAQTHYTTIEKELLAMVYVFEKFWSYLVLSKTIVYTDHSALKYLFAKQDAKPRLLSWILLLQEFNIEIQDKKGAQNLAVDHLSRLENPHQGNLVGMEIVSLTF